MSCFFLKRSLHQGIYDYTNLEGNLVLLWHAVAQLTFDAVHRRNGRQWQRHGLIEKSVIEALA